MESSGLSGSGYPFSLPVRVYYEDTDAAGVVYHASYLRFLERARTEFLRELGFEQGRLRQEVGVLFAVRRLEIRFLKPAYLDDLLLVTLSPCRSGRVRLDFEQEICRGESRLCTARVEVVCLDRERLRPVSIPEPIQEALQRWLP